MNAASRGPTPRIPQADLQVGKAWANWAGNRRCEPSTLAIPGTVEELHEIVRQCAYTGTSIRPIGSGHSFADLCTTQGTIIDLRRITGLSRLDPVASTATVRAGTRLSDFTRTLAERGYALANQGDIDVQTVAGATSTGTHGTGRAFGSLSSAVRQVELMTSDGAIRSLSADSDIKEVAAVALSLGTMGILTELTLAVVPKYRLHERTELLSWPQVRDQWNTIEAEARNAEFYWLPAYDACVLKTLRETDEIPQGQPLDELAAPGTIERYLTPARVDWSWRIYPSIRAVPFVECEMSVPITHGLDAFAALRELMLTQHRAVTWAVEYRTQGPDNAMLSPTQNAEVATISVHDLAGAVHDKFLVDAEALLSSWGGRPHWGKVHTLSREHAERQYPRLGEFRVLRAALDPQGLFLNDNLAQIFAT